MNAADLLFNLFVTVVIYSLPIIIYRYAIRKAPIAVNKAKWITVIYGIIAFFVMSAIIFALTGSGTAGGAIFLWSYVNYKILTKGQDMRSNIARNTDEINSSFIDDDPEKRMPDPLKSENLENVSTVESFDHVINDASKTQSILSTSSLPNKKKLSPRMRSWLYVACAIATIIPISIFAVNNIWREFSDNPKAIEEAVQSVVLLNCYDDNNNLIATASGFVLFDSQTVVTNYHVIENTYYVQAITENDLAFSLENVLAYNKDLDIALLQTTAVTGIKPLEIGDSSELKKGEKIVAIGSPLGVKNTVSNGIVSGFMHTNNYDAIQITASVSSGSSGGALFNNSGDVIGITSSTIQEGQSINFAVPISAAGDLYSDHGVTITLASLYNPYTPVTVNELYYHPSKYDGMKVALTAWNAACEYITSSRSDNYYKIYLVDNLLVIPSYKDYRSEIILGFISDNGMPDDLSDFIDSFSPIVMYSYYADCIEPDNTPYVDAIIYEEFVNEDISIRGNKITIYGVFTYNPQYKEGGYISDPKPRQIEVYEYRLETNEDDENVGITIDMDKVREAADPMFR